MAEPTIESGRDPLVPPTLTSGVLFDVDGTLFDTNYLHTLTGLARSLMPASGRP